MSSLRRRWTLALVAVCIAEALLVAVAVRVTTVRSFRDFVVEESFRTFVNDVQTEARTAGTVEAFRPTTRSGPPGRGHARPGAPRRPDGPPRRPSPARLGRSIAFGLADARSRVVLPFDGHERGDLLSDAVVSDGTPVSVDARRVGTAFVPQGAAAGLPAFHDRSPEGRFIRSSTEALGLALGLALLIALPLAYVLAGRTTGPLRALTDAARRIAGGDLSASVTVESKDEVGQLGDAFNAMTERLAEANALRTQMTADVSHDLRTPLTAVLGTLEAMASGTLPPTPARLASTHAEAQRLARLVDDLHTLALADADDLSLRIGRHGASQALDQTVDLFEARAAEAGVTLSVDADSALDVRADPDRLARVLSNLLGNALRHTPRGGRIVLSARDATGMVEIAVADTGSGIPPDVLPVVFERSVRADTARTDGGAGLGLSIVRSLVEAMGGSVSATSTVGTGTTVTLCLPAYEDSGSVIG